MSAVTCPGCGASWSTTAFTCGVVGCSVTHLCNNCGKGSQCNVCEACYCPEHRARCDACGETSCAYCSRRLAGDKKLLDLNCFEKKVQALGIDEVDVISWCPLSSSLGDPNYSIFNSFDPPIQLLTYSQSRTAGKKGLRPDDVQAEHFVPNSCFIVGTGRKGPVVRGAGSYAEGKALTYWVGDDQKAGTEHKFLTDRERAFCDFNEKQGTYPTLNAWLEFMETTTFDSIYQHRTYTGDLSRCKTDDDVRNEVTRAAGQAAYAVRYAMQEHYESTLNCKLAAPLKNGITGGAAPAHNVSKAQIYNFPN